MPPSISPAVLLSPSALAGAMLAVAMLAWPASDARAARLTVEISSAAGTGGSIEVSLFNSADTFMKEPFLQQSGAPDGDGRLQVVFAAVPEGQYALVAVHDENDNGMLDSGFLGFGSEAYGFSNGVRPWFGWPGFDRAAFAVEDDLAVKLRLD